MKYYAAKFARERKPRPADWIIKPVTRGFVLVYIGGLKSVR